MGVFHPDLVGIQVRVLQQLGAQRALVVWGRDGMDEITLGAGTLVGELRDGQVHEYEIHRSEEHTSELQSLMRISYAVFCLKKKTNKLLRTHYKQKNIHNKTSNLKLY